jgi:hypothetical protein
VLVGSCALSGRDWGVDNFADIARSIAKEHGLRFKMAKVYAEVPKALVRERLRSGRIHPIDPAPEYDDAAIDRSVRIVGVLGPEAYQTAMDAGADLVLAGRSTDTAIFAALPLAKGFDPGLAWHAGKIAECGTDAAVPKRRLDLLHVEVKSDSFVVEPLADDLRCTPFSVAAHMLHEVSDPYLMIEPGWRTDTRAATYEATSDRAVAVRGSVGTRTPYTVKLEGAEFAGYQQAFMFSVRDPTILESIDEWTENIRHDIEIRCEELLGPEGLSTCTATVRIYGQDGTMGLREPLKKFAGHEAFFLIDVVAPDRETCEAATSVIWYAYIHAKAPAWDQSCTVAWPFTRSIMDMGETFRFNVHHAMEVDDPMETARIEYEEVGP